MADLVLFAPGLGLKLNLAWLSCYTVFYVQNKEILLEISPKGFFVCKKVKELFRVGNIRDERGKYDSN
ncbi:MAG: hypothetical protein GX434_05205 [Peptococcaceae bacterium]|nr:hypothetical protein [Peptococcaceae bacterium]